MYASFSKLNRQAPCLIFHNLFEGCMVQNLTNFVHFVKTLLNHTMFFHVYMTLKVCHVISAVLSRIWSLQSTVTVIRPFQIQIYIDELPNEVVFNLDFKIGLSCRKLWTIFYEMKISYNSCNLLFYASCNPNLDSCIRVIFLILEFAWHSVSYLWMPSPLTNYDYMFLSK
jgi:hypothetical protein